MRFIAFPYIITLSLDVNLVIFLLPLKNARSIIIRIRLSFLALQILSLTFPPLPPPLNLIKNPANQPLLLLRIIHTTHQHPERIPTNGYTRFQPFIADAKFRRAWP